MRSYTRAALAVSVVVCALMAGTATASAETIRVDANGVAGWAFNPDPNNATPYEFSIDEESIGAGSLFVQPISATPARKFIAGLGLGLPIADLDAISYDFLIDQPGASGPTAFQQFYINVYALLPTSPPDTFYDCRFDYVPTSGVPGTWETMTVEPDTLKTAGAGSGCPASLDGMPTGSTIRAIAINVGDTSANDVGLSGYLDNVVVNDTTYDFEATPSDKNACKKGGFADYGFTNQGQCVSRSNALYK
jgi:hypothetical protein